MIEENKITFRSPWINVDSDIVLKNSDILPMNHVLRRELTSDDVGLSLMIGSTDFHINPKNNGLIIFPLGGQLKFNFENREEIVIDTPTVVNGKINHKYFPVGSSSMFYAIKVPSDISWNEIYSIVDNDR